MAQIGDVLVKFVADFAEFAKGMDDGIKKLEDFGKQTARTSANMDSFFSLVKRGFIALGVKEAVHQLLEYAETLQKNAVELQAQATALGLTTDKLQAYKAAAQDAGVASDAIVNAVQRFSQAMVSAQNGNKQQIDALNQLGVKILDTNGKMRDQEMLLQATAQAILRMPEGIKRTNVEIALFGQTGETLRRTLEQLATGSDSLVNKYKQLGLVLDQETIQKFDEMEKKANIAKQRIDNLLAPIYANVKSTVLSLIADELQDINDVLNAWNIGVWDTIMAVLNLPKTAVGLGALIGRRLAGEDVGLSEANKALGEANEKVRSLRTELDRLQNNPGPNDWAGNIPVVKQQLEEAEKRAKSLASIVTRGIADPDAAVPGQPIVKTADGRNPAVVGGGGGGRTDDQSIDAQIKRYQALEVAANKTARTIADNHDKEVDDLQREIKVQTQVLEIAAKLGAKYDEADPKRKEALENQIRAYEVAKEANERNLQIQQQAVETEKKYGDGSKALQLVQRDLGRQLATNKLTTEGYNRALKEQTEQTQLAALAARRYDYDLGSLQAGFQAATLQYARQNDLYSTGSHAFTGFMDAMGESLDVLLGKSDKTFGQIAADFAEMLAKMALQAAISQVFQTIFAAGTGNVTAAVAPAGGYLGTIDPNTGIGYAIPRRQHGGAVGAGMPYVVGEAGPELFVPKAAGNIVPNSSLGGNITVNVAMGQTQGAADPTAALAFGRKIKAAVADVIANEKRPGGSLYQRMS
jgi:hypothetical protein